MKGYELKIELMDYNKAFKDAQNNDVWFKLQVPAEYTFAELHHAIMLCTNWEDYHMYNFEFKKLKITVQDKDDDAYPLRGAESFIQSIKQQILSGKIDLSKLKDGESISSVDFNMNEFPENDTGNFFKPKKTKLIDLFEKEKTCRYMYDFGDNWECKIAAKILDDFDGMIKVIDFEGKWPPEDCGGIGGYAELLEQMAKVESGNKKAKNHEMLEWLSGMKYENFDVPCINESLAQSTKKKAKINKK